MRPKVHSGDLCTVVPTAEYRQIKKGDVVLCVVKGREYLHLVKAVQKVGAGYRYTIGNNKGGTNGVIDIRAIFGVLKEVER